MKHKKIDFAYYCMAAIAMVSMQSCGGESAQTTSGHTEAGETLVEDGFSIDNMYHLSDTVLTDRELTVSLFSDAPLTSKHENLYIHVENLDGSPSTDVSVDFHTYMDMGMMSHGGPFSKPEQLAGGWIKGGAVFIMPDMDDMGKGWLLRTQLSKDGITDSLTFKLPVTQATVTRTVPFDGGKDGRFFISLLLPDTASVGRLPVDFVLHHVDHNVFPTASGYTVKLEPYMPEMKHGSKDNEDATSLGAGDYRGMVNLPMAGLWEIHGTLLKDGQQVSTDPIIFKVQVTASN